MSYSSVVQSPTFFSPDLHTPFSPISFIPGILRLGYGVRDLRSYEIRALKAQGQTPQSKKVKIAEKLVLRFQRQVWKWRLYCTILVALIFNFALCALPENMIARQ